MKKILLLMLSLMLSINVYAVKVIDEYLEINIEDNDFINFYGIKHEEYMYYLDDECIESDGLYCISKNIIIKKYNNDGYKVDENLIVNTSYDNYNYDYKLVYNNLDIYSPFIVDNNLFIYNYDPDGIHIIKIDTNTLKITDKVTILGEVGNLSLYGDTTVPSIFGNYSDATYTYQFIVLNLDNMNNYKLLTEDEFFNLPQNVFAKKIRESQYPTEEYGLTSYFQQVNNYVFTFPSHGFFLDEITGQWTEHYQIDVYTTAGDKITTLKDSDGSTEQIKNVKQVSDMFDLNGEYFCIVYEEVTPSINKHDEESKRFLYLYDYDFNLVKKYDLYDYFDKDSIKYIDFDYIKDNTLYFDVCNEEYLGDNVCGYNEPKWKEISQISIYEIGSVRRLNINEECPDEILHQATMCKGKKLSIKLPSDDDVLGEVTNPKTGVESLLWIMIPLFILITLLRLLNKKRYSL